MLPHILYSRKRSAVRREPYACTHPGLATNKCRLRHAVHGKPNAQAQTHKPAVKHKYLQPQRLQTEMPQTAHNLTAMQRNTL